MKLLQSLLFDADRSCELQLQLREASQLVGARTVATASVDIAHVIGYVETRFVL